MSDKVKRGEKNNIFDIASLNNELFKDRNNSENPISISVKVKTMKIFKYNNFPPCFTVHRSNSTNNF